MWKIIKKFVNNSIGMIGYRLVRAEKTGIVALESKASNVMISGDKFGVRHTMLGTLQNAKKIGFYPKTVVDIGAAYGTIQLYDTFPDAQHLLVEPIQEYEKFLQKLQNQRKNIQYLISCASSKKQEIMINVHNDLVGSSIYNEEEKGNDGTPRRIKTIVIDDAVKEKGLKGPFLLKIDVQGAELDVLKGCEEVLSDTEFLIVEAVLFNFFKGGPTFYDMVKYMYDRGFVVYDIIDPLCRLLDGATSQVDLVFVKENGAFRQSHIYATKEQRIRQNEQMQKNREILNSKK